MKDVPDDTQSSIIEYTYQFEKRPISPLIKRREDDDFQRKLDQANKDFLSPTNTLRNRKHIVSYYSQNL